MAFQTNVPKFFTKEEVNEFADFLDRYVLLEKAKPQRTFYYVILLDDIIVGSGGFGDRYGNGRLTLTWGLLHKKYHKKGLGKALLLHRLENAAKVYPNAKVFLDTTQHTQGFFAKFGFKVEKISKDYYAEGMHRYDMVLQI